MTGMLSAQPGSGSQWFNFNGPQPSGAPVAQNTQIMARFQDWGGMRLSGTGAVTFYSFVMFGTGVISSLYGLIRLVARPATWTGSTGFGGLISIYAQSNGTTAQSFGSHVIDQTPASGYITSVTCTPSGNTLPLVLNIGGSLTGNYDYQWWAEFEIT